LSDGCVAGFGTRGVSWECFLFGSFALFFHRPPGGAMLEA